MRVRRDQRSTTTGIKRVELWPEPLQGCVHQQAGRPQRMIARHHEARAQTTEKRPYLLVRSSYAEPPNTARHNFICSEESSSAACYGHSQRAECASPGIGPVSTQPVLLAATAPTNPASTDTLHNCHLLASATSLQTAHTPASSPNATS